MLAVELIYDSDCPNLARTRENLLRAFAESGVPARWTEWERSRSETPDHARQFGSPAVLVNGKDITGLPGNSAAACRIYRTAGGASSGVPSIALIAKALRCGARESGRTDWAALKKHLPLLPAVLVALLPKLVCPACWPAYVGLLSAVGLGFLTRTEYLLPLTAVFLVIVLAALACRAGTRRGYGPLALGTIGAELMLLGKFHLSSNSLFYSGLTVLIGSSLWNTWPRRESKTAPCCGSTAGGAQVTSAVQEN